GTAPPAGSLQPSREGAGNPEHPEHLEMTVSSKPPLSIVDHDRSAGEETDPRAPLVPAEAHSPATLIRFGAFYLWPMQRLLLQDNQPVRLGSRALDILIALLERPGDLVGKDELMARVWPKAFVQPANLTVQITALRPALGAALPRHRALTSLRGRARR